MKMSWNPNPQTSWSLSLRAKMHNHSHGHEVFLQVQLLAPRLAHLHALGLGCFGWPPVRERLGS